MRAAAIVALALVAGCRCGGGEPRSKPELDAGPPADARARPPDPDFAPLDGLPRVRPRWTRTLPEQPVPAIDVHGPVIVDGVAVVSGSAIGIAAVDLDDGELLWQRPAGTRVGPPAVIGGRLLAAGECTLPIGGDDVIGCYVVLDPRKQAVYGSGSIVSETAPGAGPTSLVAAEGWAYLGREGTWVRWRLPDPPRGEVRAEPVDRRDVPPAPGEPRLTAGEGDDRVDAWIVDDVLELRHHRPDVMSSRSAVKDIAGGTGTLSLLADSRTRGFRYVPGEARIQPVLIDLATIDFADLGPAVPGIDLLAAAQAEDGFVIAVRLDATLAHDYVARFSGDGTVVWVWPLPPPPGGGRALPVGLALAGDGGVVVFHDGTTLAYLP